MKTKKEVLDYVKSRKEFYEKEIKWCEEKLTNPYINYNDFKVYDWMKTEHESRLEVINDLVNFIYDKEE